jgi:hypothetical protein
MRIWDVHPGYLNDRSLLGEHRELHGIVTIVSRGKSGYSRHPETLRWKGYGWALAVRHRILRAEMALRGFSEKTPVRLRGNPGAWPQSYIDVPARQFQLLQDKYRGKPHGRIPLPANACTLWAQHKYSVLAREPRAYEEIGRRVARMGRGECGEMARELSEWLRIRPEAGRLMNALQHMWGYVSHHAPGTVMDPPVMNAAVLLGEIQALALRHRHEYLLASTALSDLAVWV